MDEASEVLSDAPEEKVSVPAGNVKESGWSELFRKHTMSLAEKVCMTLFLALVALILRSPVEGFLEALKKEQGSREERTVEIFEGAERVCGQFSEWIVLSSRIDPARSQIESVRRRLDSSLAQLAELNSLGFETRGLMSEENAGQLEALVPNLVSEVDKTLERADDGDYVKLSGNDLGRRSTFLSLRKEIVSPFCEGIRHLEFHLDRNRR